MQSYSNTGDGSLSVFLQELVQRHLESVLAANVPEPTPENTSYDQPPEAPGGGGDDLQCRLSVEYVPPMCPDDDPQPVSDMVSAVLVENPGGEGKPGFPTEENGGEGREPECGGQPESVKMSEEEQALVVSCEERVKALAWKYADGSYDRFEEFVSIGMLGACEAAASLPPGFPDPQGYLCQAARHDMLDELYRLHACPTARLDAPLSESGSFTLHDLLPSLAVVAAAPVSKRERALHGALMRLSVRQRAAVRRRAGLPGYGVQSLEEIGRVVHSSSDAAHCLDQWGRRKLRRDAVLCEVMGVEVER